MSDAHTIRIPITRGVSYVPIPAAAGENDVAGALADVEEVDFHYRIVARATTAVGSHRRAGGVR